MGRSSPRPSCGRPSTTADHAQVFLEEQADAAATSASIVHASAAHSNMDVGQSPEQALLESTPADAADANAVPKKLAPVGFDMGRKQRSEQAMLQGGPLECKVVTLAEAPLRSLEEPPHDAWSSARLPTPMGRATRFAWLSIELSKMRVEVNGTALAAQADPAVIAATVIVDRTQGPWGNASTEPPRRRQAPRMCCSALRRAFSMCRGCRP